jgi:hypothetical protein
MVVVGNRDIHYGGVYSATSSHSNWAGQSMVFHDLRIRDTGMLPNGKAYCTNWKTIRPYT